MVSIGHTEAACYKKHGSLQIKITIIQNTKKKNICIYCERNGHTIGACYRKHQFHNNMFDIAIKSCNPTCQQQVTFEPNKHGIIIIIPPLLLIKSVVLINPLTYLQDYQEILASTRFKHQSSIKYPIESFVLY